MGKCPFGFTGEAEDDGSISEELQDAAQMAGPGPDKAKSKSSKSKVLGAMPDMDTDPIAWFQKNQIKSDADFQARKEALRAEAKKRLDFIMDKKNQRLMWPSDSEFDDMSISSGELSELDSDVHSLASIRTCAYSWISKHRYGMHAELSLRIAAGVGVALSLASLYVSFQGVQTSRQYLAAVKHSEWLTYAMLLSIVAGGAASSLMLSTNWRSRRMLLFGQAASLVTYGLATALSVMMWLASVEVDPRMRTALCSIGAESRRTRKAHQESPMCAQLPVMQASVENLTTRLRWLMAALAVCAAVLVGLGVWYTFELCFIEKKGAKHMRRHRRNRFKIPWEKIKVVGKPLPCGGGGGGAPGAFRPVGYKAKAK